MHYSKLSENITVQFSTYIHNAHLYIAKHTENEQYKKDSNRRKRRQEEQEWERRGPRKKRKSSFQEVGEESPRYRAQER